MRICKKTICFSIFAGVLVMPVLYEIGYACFYTHLSSLDVYRIGFYPCEEKIPLMPSKEYPPGEYREVSLSAKNGGSLSYSLEFFEELEDLRIRGSGWTPSGKGILSPCYIVSDPEIKRKIIDFLLIHRAVLLHAENAGIIRQFAAKHKEDLARFGDGDPYVGLERAGVAEWIKAGKDPEAEWQKKFPAGSGAEQ